MLKNYIVPCVCLLKFDKCLILNIKQPYNKLKILNYTRQLWPMNYLIVLLKISAWHTEVWLLLYIYAC